MTRLLDEPDRPTSTIREVDRSFFIERSIALNSHFSTKVDRSFLLFLKCDRPYLLFHARRSRSLLEFVKTCDRLFGVVSAIVL
ncbi:hypothetical protein IQ270_12645 [Microcoleus sp. LEGE 07076]|uniref:hypothetical protein n=1 Tax=Microcoleus sp. LEGE 07076 TaxID=915322 RepID=UPI00187E7F6B|nr:hypothetical protein [Microcoleus sp. LEGE 07076]MBE9185526.1 hypothetical protein [Microcoleus sp. LEGE 07076]